MDNIFFYAIQSLTETIGFIVLNLAILKAAIKWKWVLLGSCLIVVPVYLFRILPFTFGIHMFVEIALLLLFLGYFLNSSLIKNVVSLFVSIVCFIVVEYIMTAIFFGIYDLDLSADPTSQFQLYPLAWTLWGLLQSLVIISGGLLLHKLRKPVAGIWKR